MDTPRPAAVHGHGRPPGYQPRRGLRHCRWHAAGRVASFYFNAVRVDAAFHKNHKLILFFHSQEPTDRFLPLINDRSQPLADQPEKALAFYYTGSFGKTNLDAYAVRKTTGKTDLWPFAGITDTFGTRLQMPILRPFMLTAEGALQTGIYGDASRLAVGGNFHFDYDLKGVLPLLKTATVGGIY